MARSDEVEPGRSRIHSLATVGLGLFLLAGAVGKALAPDGAAGVVVFLLEPVGAGRPTAMAMVSGVILLEGLLAWGLLCRVRLRAMLTATFVMLVAFTLVLTQLTMWRHAPACGCGGAFSLATQIEDSPAAGVVRNVVLLWVVCWLWLGAPGPQPMEDERPQKWAKSA